jgi:hypothetical protein
MSNPEAHLALLRRHFDLIPLRRQPFARWLCESWPECAPVPHWLRRVSWQEFTQNLNSPEAAQLVLRDLVLQLLSSHRQTIARRNRTGAGISTPLGPRP